MKTPAARLIIVFLFIQAFMSPRSSVAFTFEGPLQVKNLFPLFIPAAQPYLEQASLHDSFSANISHASVYMTRESPAWSSHMDLELTELNLRLRKNFPGLFEAGVDVPVLRATAGFMDRPLAWYHETFGFPDYGRKKRPHNEFLYDIRRGGLPVIQGKNDKTGFGDVRLTLKKEITHQDPALSILAFTELPTGDAKIGYGSGSFDWGFAALLDKQVMTDARIYANLGAFFPGDLKAHQTVKLNDFYYAGLGVEYFAFQNLSLLVHCLAQTSPYPHTGISKIDNTGMLLVFGGRKYTRSGSYELSLSEDLSTAGAPDFIFNLSYITRF